MTTYAFGRGSSNCIMAARQPGAYVHVMVGNGKTNEMSPPARFSVWELHQLHEFFYKLWIDWGQDMFVEPIYAADDPCDDWSTWDDPCNWWRPM